MLNHRSTGPVLLGFANEAGMSKIQLSIDLRDDHRALAGD